MLTPGTVLKGRYRIEEMLGSGGMAEVYRAWDGGRQHFVAVKIMREDLSEDLEFVRRFRNEAGALASLMHENVVRFYGLDQDGARVFIVMDYVPGSTLRRHIADYAGVPLPFAEALDITRQVCAALHYAHSQGLIHRDVKPGNVMLRPDGRALLADFGIARVADAATMTTAVIGAPRRKMAPEQCQNRPLDARADIYSLGVMVYEMLAGRRPFLGHGAGLATESTSEKIRWEQMHTDPPPPAQFNPALPPAAAAVILQALAKEPSLRPASALDFWQALAAAFGYPAEPAPAETVAPATGPIQASAVTPAAAAMRGGARPRASRGLWAFGTTVILGLAAILVAGRLLGGPNVLPTSVPGPTTPLSAQPSARVVPSPAVVETPVPAALEASAAATQTRLAEMAVVATQVRLAEIASAAALAATTTRLAELATAHAAAAAVTDAAQQATLAAADAATRDWADQMTRSAQSVEATLTAQAQIISVTPAPPQPAPDQAVDQYYSLILSRNYRQTWDLLSHRFKLKFNCCTASGDLDYADYVSWWDSVSNVVMGSVQILSNSGDAAVVLTGLRYRLKDGRTLVDSNPRIYLVWDTAGQRWMFDDKTP